MNSVMGQTGKMVLSIDAANYKLAKRRTVRFQFTRLKYGFEAWICGPFHSPIYGACARGRTKEIAREALSRTLANNHSYHGNMMFSDVDEADNIGGGQ